VEGVECVRRDVCTYKERSLVGLEVPPAEDVKTAPGPESWVVVAEEVEGATCILLLQLFWIATPAGHDKKRESGCKSSAELRRRTRTERGPRVESCGRLQ